MYHGDSLMGFRTVLSLAVLLCLSVAAAAAPSTYEQDSGESITCEPFADPKNGWVSHMVNKGALHTAVFSCDDGYAIIGKNTITCNDGVWERDALQCTAIDCGPPESIENGRVHYTETKYQSKAHYSCDPCYTLEGWKRRSCKQSGMWSKKSPACVLKECSPPFLAPNLILKNNETILCASNIEVECKPGYRLQGANVATCLPGPAYFWHGASPSCI